MRNTSDRDPDVTYIGPRTFVGGFAVVCGLFLVTLFGAGRIAESLETPSPAVASKSNAATTTASLIPVNPRPEPAPAPRLPLDVARRSTAPAKAISPDPSRTRSAAVAVRARATPRMLLRRLPVAKQQPVVAARPLAGALRAGAQLSVGQRPSVGTGRLPATLLPASTALLVPFHSGLTLPVSALEPRSAGNALVIAPETTPVPAGGARSPSP